MKVFYLSWKLWWKMFLLVILNLKINDKIYYKSTLPYTGGELLFYFQNLTQSFVHLIMWALIISVGAYLKIKSNFTNKIKITLESPFVSINVSKHFSFQFQSCIRLYVVPILAPNLQGSTSDVLSSRLVNQLCTPSYVVCKWRGTMPYMYIKMGEERTLIICTHQ